MIATVATVVYTHNEASETIVDRLAIHDKPGAMNKLMTH
jgi:hypothetical protein